jgi:hypothetical protein
MLLLNTVTGKESEGHQRERGGRVRERIRRRRRRKREGRQTDRQTDRQADRLVV